MVAPRSTRLPEINSWFGRARPAQRGPIEAIGARSPVFALLHQAFNRCREVGEGFGLDGHERPGFVGLQVKLWQANELISSPVHEAPHERLADTGPAYQRVKSL